MVAPLAIIGAIGGALSMASMFPPVAREMQYRTNSAIPNQELQIMELIELGWRGILERKDVLTRLEKWGLDSDKAFELFSLTSNKFQENELIVLLRKDVIDKPKYYREMLKLGYETIEADLILDSREYLPNVQDLVRFAVREVYSDDIIEKFQLDEAFPEKFANEALKVGMDREQALNFWRSHWILPSLTNGYEMLHRNVIDEDELDLLMRTQDIMPFWRDKLKQISYAPFTRVDARRMFEHGVLGEEELLQAYKDIGYDEDKALKLVEWTKKYVLSPERDLTRTMLEKAYLQDEINREEAINYLQDLGYDETEADLILTLKDNEENIKEIDDKIDVVESLLVSGVITFEETIERLDKLNLRGNYRDKVYARLIRAFQKDKVFLSKTDLKELVTQQIIDKEFFAEAMQRLGFELAHIKLLYKLYTNLEYGD